MYDYTQHSRKASKRSTPRRVKRLAAVLDSCHEVLVAATEELQRVVPGALVVGQVAKVFVDGETRDDRCTYICVGPLRDHSTLVCRKLM